MSDTMPEQSRLMTPQERRFKIQNLQRRKEAVAHEMAQADKHAQWHEGQRRGLEEKWEALDAEQWPLVCKELGYHG